MRDIWADIETVLIDEATLQARIQAVAAQIEADYAAEKDLLLICVLKGAFMFLSDISRALKRAHSVDFMGISSYGKGTTSKGAVQIIMDLKAPIEDRNVLIVEDIIDSGHTIASVLNLLGTRQPKSLKVCALLDKPSRREAYVPIHYCGFEIANKFVFGYGLDLDEYYRNLRFVGVVDLDKYKPPA